MSTFRRSVSFDCGIAHGVMNIRAKRFDIRTYYRLTFYKLKLVTFKSKIFGSYDKAIGFVSMLEGIISIFVILRSP